jgi:hypothetical protein
LSRRRRQGNLSPAMSPRRAASGPAREIYPYPLAVLAVPTPCPQKSRLLQSVVNVSQRQKPRSEPIFVKIMQLRDGLWNIS